MGGPTNMSRRPKSIINMSLLSKLRQSRDPMVTNNKQKREGLLKELRTLQNPSNRKSNSIDNILKRQQMSRAKKTSNNRQKKLLEELRKRQQMSRSKKTSNNRQ